MRVAHSLAQEHLLSTCSLSLSLSSENTAREVAIAKQEESPLQELNILAP